MCKIGLKWGGSFKIDFNIRVHICKLLTLLHSKKSVFDRNRGRTWTSGLGWGCPVQLMMSGRHLVVCRQVLLLLLAIMIPNMFLSYFGVQAHRTVIIPTHLSALSTWNIYPLCEMHILCQSTLETHLHFFLYPTMTIIKYCVLGQYFWQL